MIISIDQSPLWRAQRAGKEELSQLLEALFRSRPRRRPASGLEVLFLARALECSEAAIERHSAQPRRARVPAESAGDSVATCSTRGSGGRGLLLMQSRVQQSYSPTKPA